jgi:hypothetical protein
MWLGVAAGLLGGLITIVLVYLVGVGAIHRDAPDLATTLFAAVTYLLLMVFLLILPHMLVALLVGLLLGVAANFRAHSLGVGVGALIGLACGELCFSLLLPAIMPPQPDPRFLNILTNPYYTAIYGLVLGALTGLFFRWFDNKQRKA